MRVYVFPADAYGCGNHRLIWPARELAATGHDVEVVEPSRRAVQLDIEDDRAVRIHLPADADVAVFQRVTNRWLAQAIPLVRAAGVAAVVDVDDDLAAIHPGNPAFAALHPRNENRLGANGRVSRHSWHHLRAACEAATLVTVSTPALLPRYAAHGRGRVLRNVLAAHYYGIERADSDLVGWPASLHSHPDDPAAVGSAVAIHAQRGGRFAVLAKPDGVGRAFGLPEDPLGVHRNTDILDWPRLVATIGVGIAPLADTRFNAAKSWLKPLEMSAVGVPWVASPRPEYAELHGRGAGVLAEKPKRWLRALAELAGPGGDRRRAELSEAGRAVAADLSLEAHAWRWWEAWSNALDLERGANHAATAQSV